MGDFLEPLSGINSQINKYKVNCVEGKRTWLNSTVYSQSMGRGKIVAESNHNKIKYPKPNTAVHEVMKFACDYAK